MKKPQLELTSYSSKYDQSTIVPDFLRLRNSVRLDTLHALFAMRPCYERCGEEIRAVLSLKRIGW